MKEEKVLGFIVLEGLNRGKMLRKRRKAENYGK